MITGQAAMIAYLDDFRLMFSITICAAPLLLILRHRPQVFAGPPGVRPAAAQQPAAAMAE